jgi:RecA/RadA recombinase
MAKDKKIEIEDSVYDEKTLEALKTIQSFITKDKAIDLEIERLGDVIDYPYWITSGNIALNLINSGCYDKCIPGTKVIDICGLPSTGKSLLIAKFLGEAVKLGGLAFVVDTENAWNKQFVAKIVGDEKIANEIRVNKKVDTIERLEVFLNRIINLAKNQKWTIPIIVAIDSISQLTTEHEVELINDEDNKKKDMFKAGLIKRMFRVLNRKLRDTNFTIITTNHLIANIGVMYGPSHTTGGGSGVPYSADIRMQMLSPKKIEHVSSHHPIGVKVHTKITKNRIVGEGRSCFTNLIFKGGIDKFSGLFELLYEYEVIALYNKNAKFGKSSEITNATRVLWEVNKETYEKFPNLHAVKYYTTDELAKLKKKNEQPEKIPGTLEFKITKVQEFLNEVGEDFVLKNWQDLYNEVIDKQEKPEDYIVDSTGESEEPDEDESFAEKMLEQIEQKKK